MKKETRNKNRAKRRKSWVRAGAVAVLATLVVGAVGPRPANAAGPVEPAPTVSFADQHEQLREAREFLAGEGIEFGTGAQRTSVAAVPGLGASFFSGVVRGLGTVGVEGGFRSILAAMGANKTQNMLNDMNTSLAELMSDVDAMATRMEQLFSDTQFKNTHVLARGWYDTVDGHARLIEQHERDGTTPSAVAIDTMAATNYDAISNLRGLLTDTTTGALPLMMKSMADAAPVNTGEHWDDLDAYREHFLGVQAMALTNIAWLAQHEASHETKLAPGRAIALQTLDHSYALTGAPHPQDPTGGKFLHRIGEATAFMTGDRTALKNETHHGQTWVVHSNLLGPLMAPITDYQSTDGRTLEQYMTDNGFMTSTRLHDRYGWDILVNGSGRTGTMVAWGHRGEIHGNEYRETKNEYFRQESSARRDLMENHLKNMTAKNQADLMANPQFWWMPIETNDYGWAALTDKESVRMARDGLRDLEIKRGTGNTIDVSFRALTYDSIQVTDVRTDKVLHHGPLTTGALAVGTLNADTVMIELGYDVDGAFDGRGGSVITSNPDESTIDLALSID